MPHYVQVIVWIFIVAIAGYSFFINWEYAAHFHSLIYSIVAEFFGTKAPTVEELQARKKYLEETAAVMDAIKQLEDKGKGKGLTERLKEKALYEKEVKQAPVNSAFYAGIDIGTNNLVALSSNKPGFRASIVNGRPVKSVNQFYNKRRADLQKQLGHMGTTKRMERMTTKRNRRIDHYMHTASKRIIDLLVEEGIGVLCIGKNDAWKQEANMGKRNNQNFVQTKSST